MHVYCGRVLLYLYRSVQGIRARKIYVAIHIAAQLFHSECIHAAWRIDTYIDIIVLHIKIMNCIIIKRACACVYTYKHDIAYLGVSQSAYK